MQIIVIICEYTALLEQSIVNAKLLEIHFGKLFFFVQCVEGSLIRQPELWNFRSLMAFTGTTWTVGSSSGNRRESVSPSPSQSSTFSKRLRTEDVQITWRYTAGAIETFLLIHARQCAFNLTQCALNLDFFPK